MAYLQSAFTWLQNMFNENMWVLVIFSIVFVTLVLHATQAFVFHRLHNRLLKTRTFWDNTLVWAANKPLGFLIWIYGFSFAIEVAPSAIRDSEILAYVGPLREFAFVALLVWFLLRFIRCAEENYLKAAAEKNKDVDKTAVHAVVQLLIVAITITATLIVLPIFGINVSALLALSGIGGVTVALAAKDLVANFFGGVMIYLDRPFNVGNWIRSPDKNIEGVVEHVGWRLTRIRTFDKRPLYVPNSVFSAISVENPSRMTNRRIKTKVGLRYSDATKVKMILKDVEEMLRNHPDIDTKQTLMVNLVEFGSSALNFLIYTFTKTTKWIEFQKIQQDVFLKVIDIIDSHGAECAFPTQTLHIPDGLQVNSNEI